ncbi:hypothetical protein [Geminocystis sp. NIES-3709]|uniref:hypothetical protein n=1 Tax=Geminocystis sp. NIES-3709 TaxID=1617448 RepID=UPI0005FC92DC|nr:hypothetical protein [Geminocystis sp. NIES-3709]BAQ67071.1 hypothetical protein GM3709_3836 [Geminocystis sp. NIES-3709]
MANITPAQLFPGLTIDGTDVVIPLEDLAGLTSVEADPATGDGRELARVLLDTIASKVLALSTANRPTKMTVTKANPQGIGIDSVRQAYTMSFDVSIDATGAALVAEA